MASVDEETRLRLLRWGIAVTADLSDKISSLPEDMRYAAIAYLVLGLMGEIIWRSGDPEQAAERLKEMVGEAMKIQPAVDKMISEKMEAVRQGKNREPGHG